MCFIQQQQQQQQQRQQQQQQKKRKKERKKKRKKGDIIHDSKSVITEAKSFYKQLYASKETDILDEAINENLDHPTLTSEERDSLEGLINIQELSIAVTNLNNNKSPGADGHTT